MAFMEKHLPDKFYLQGIQRISLRDKFFREVVANMLIHREYTNAFPSSFIIYKDKVVTQNANNALTIGRLEPGNYKPFPKNPDIANIFTQIGYSEELGTGIQNVYKYTEQYSGKGNIIFKEDDIFVTEVPLKTKELNEPLNNRQISIVSSIKNDPNITIAGLSEKYNAGRETVKRDLIILQENNIIKRVGSKKTGCWEILNN